MKRLLCIVGSMNAGGAETFLMKMYRALDKQKYQMDFAVAISEKGFYDDEIISMGGIIHHITPKSRSFIKNFNDIRELVQNNNYNYVMRISQHSLSGLELLAAKLGGARVRVFRSSNSNTTSDSKLNQILHKLCMFMPAFFANVRIAPSTEAAEFMFGDRCIEKGKASLLPNAIDTSIFRYNEDARCSIRKEFFINKNQLVVGHIGRFNQQKNHRFLIEVFAEVLKQKPDALLMLVGDGEKKNEIKEQINALGIEESVILTGIRSDVPALLSAMDVFVFPSFYEGMPNTVIEAQATGLPCVIADTITREACITDCVEYKPLTDSAESWADFTVSLFNNCKEDRSYYNYKMKNAGYDISSCVEQFTKLTFEGGVENNANKVK